MHQLRHFMRRSLSLGLALLLSALLSACQNLPFLYKADLTQGNVYGSQQLAQLQRGMSRDEVHQLFGTPVVVDPFRPNEDQYIYYYASGSSRQTYQRTLTIYYQDNRVINAEQTPITVR
ncbi:MAG: outer membrane protein assembly factor BamE [Cardiobacteriaceae bacterium]|nr:outer membrane protein assembly factor BamE [Cardiobacteriaceae bacterium]